MWFTLALLAGLLFAVNKLIFRATFLKNVNPTSFLAAHDGLAGVLLLPFAINNMTMPRSNSTWWALIAGSFLIFLANYYAALALKYTEASSYQIIGQFRHIVVLLGAAILFSELITASKIISILFIIIGVAIAIRGKGRFKLDRGFVYSLLSAASIGLAFLYIKKASVDVRPVVSATIALITSGILAYSVTVLRRHKNKKIDREHHPQLLVAAIIFAIFELLLFTALDIGEASRVTPVTQSSVIFTIAGAFIFLNERSHMLRKIAGTSLIAVGIVILYFF